MSREIKFRGLTQQNKWVYGLPGFDSSGHIGNIVVMDTEGNERAYEVQKKTIGQYIGILGKLKKEIYEGDIIKWDDESQGKYWRVARVDMNPDIQFVIVKNTIHELSTRFPDKFHFGNFIYKDGSQLHVIGNIYENPNLSTNQ